MSETDSMGYSTGSPSNDSMGYSTGSPSNVSERRPRENTVYIKEPTGSPPDDPNTPSRGRLRVRSNKPKKYSRGRRRSSIERPNMSERGSMKDSTDSPLNESNRYSAGRRGSSSSVERPNFDFMDKHTGSYSDDSNIYSIGRRGSNSSVERPNFDFMEKHTGSYSDDSNRYSTGRRGSNSSVERPNFVFMQRPTGSPSNEPKKPSRGRRRSNKPNKCSRGPDMSETDSMEDATGSPSDEPKKPSRGRKRSNKPNRYSSGRRGSSSGERPNLSETDYMDYATDSPSDAPLPPMNLMLFGRKGIQRTSIGNIILSQSYQELNLSLTFWKKQAEVCGYAVTLVEVPSLATTPLSQEEVREKSHRSISQCAPGINAFLLALPEGPLTDEDKDELQMIQSIFGPRVNDYIMILYTSVSCPKGKPVQDSQEEKKHLEQQFPKGCFVLSQEGGHEQISEMLQKIKGKSDKCFTADMFVEAQIEERGRLQTELEKKREREDEDKKQLKEMEEQNQKQIEMMKQLSSSPVIQNPDSTPDMKRDWERQGWEWTKTREEETKRRQKEDEESRRNFRELQDEFEREKEEEKKRKKKEDEYREEEHKRKIKEIEDQNQKRIDIDKNEDEPQKKAEEFNGFSEKSPKDFEALEGQNSSEADKQTDKSKEMCVLL